MSLKNLLFHAKFPPVKVFHYGRKGAPAPTPLRKYSLNRYGRRCSQQPLPLLEMNAVKFHIVLYSF